MTLALYRRLRVRVTDDSGQGRLWDEAIRIDLDIEEDLQEAPGLATLSLHNLAPESRSWLVAGRLVLVEVGYGADDPQPLFLGRVESVRDTHEPPERVTVLECSGGGREFRRSRTSVLLRAGTRMDLAVEQVARPLVQQGITLRREELTPLRARTLAQPLTLSGRTLDALRELVSLVGLTAGIQDQELRLLPRSASDSGASPLVLLTPDSGLLGSPVRTDAGLEVLALLDPRLRPGRLVQVRSREIDGGVFRVERAQHRGSLWTDEWTSSLELRDL